MDKNDDTPTAICAEITKILLSSPNVNTGTFMSTAAYSERDICRSDTVLIITAAIMEHIGNKEAAQKQISRSATCSKFYERLGLANKDIRGLFVTMIFSMNPSFVKMVENSIIMALDRRSNKDTSAITDFQVKESMNLLAESKTINNDDLISAPDRTLRRKSISINRNSYNLRTPTEMIAPNDSVTSVGEIPSYRKKLKEEDVLEYLKRKKHGIEPKFSDVFSSAPEPISVKPRSNRAGIGSDSNIENARMSVLESKVNNILGSMTVPSYILNSGDMRRRRPRVEDYLESELPSYEAMRVPTEIAPNTWDDITPAMRRGPSPTEDFLPDSVINTSSDANSTLRPVDSYEILMTSLRDADINV